MSRNGTFHYAWIVIATGMLLIFAALGLARFGYGILLPSMQTALGIGNTEAGLLATANLTGYLLFSVVGGFLAARFGPRAVITVGLLVTGAGMLLTAIARSAAEVAVWRALTGMGSGATNVPVMGLLAAWTGVRRRGLAAGLGVAGSSVGLILLGPTVPRLLAAGGDNGWRMCWALFGVITAVLAGLAWAVLRNSPADLGMLPWDAAEDDDAPAVSSAPALGIGSVYRMGHVWLLGLVYVAFGFSYIIFMTFFVKRLTAECGYSAEGAGELFMLMGWLSLFCGVLWGVLSDRLGRKRALVGVYLTHTAAYLLFARSNSPSAAIATTVLFGLSAWSIPAIMSAACSDVVGPRLAPAALGFVTLFFGIGQATGPAVAGALSEYAGGLGPAFLLAAAVAGIGAAASLALPHHRTVGS